MSATTTDGVGATREEIVQVYNNLYDEIKRLKRRLANKHADRALLREAEAALKPMADVGLHDFTPDDYVVFGKMTAADLRRAAEVHAKLVKMLEQK